MNKYCVASVHVNSDGPSVSYYAYLNNSYGLHTVSDWKNEHVIWYDTEIEAMKNRLNPEDCVLGFCTDNIHKFKRKDGNV